MMHQNPLVSIIINCFNGEKYLQEALNSIRNQTYSNWEIVFWDNQSTDDSAKIFKSNNDPRFRYFYAPKHTKLYEARNKAFQYAQGELVAFLDTDDTWDADKLAQQVPLFDDSSVGIVYGNYRLNKDNVDNINSAFEFELPEGNILNALFEEYSVGLLTLVVRRTVAKRIKGPFDPRLHIIGDFDFVVKLAKITRALAVQKPIATYRIHAESETSKNLWMSLDEFDLWFEEQSNDHAVIQNSSYKLLKQRIRINRISMLIRTGRSREARKMLRELPWNYSRIRLEIASFLPPKLINTIKAANR